MDGRFGGRKMTSNSEERIPTNLRMLLIVEVLAKAGRPLARLVAYEPRPMLKFGSLKGKIEIPDDFDRIAADEIAAMFNDGKR